MADHTKPADKPPPVEARKKEARHKVKNPEAVAIDRVGEVFEAMEAPSRKRVLLWAMSYYWPEMKVVPATEATA